LANSFVKDLTVAKMTSMNAGILSLRPLANVTGSDFKEELRGGVDADLVSGAGGDDTLIGLDGNDTLAGDAGNDRIFGDLGNDVVSGGDGIDGAGYGYRFLSSLTAGVSFNASTTGGAGTLTLNAGVLGRDTLDGIEYVVVLGSNFNDSFTGGLGDDVLIGDGGADTLVGGEGNDFLSGLTDFGSGRDAGGIDGADSLSGGNGNDLLRGNSGNDALNGGAGDDNLRGDAGNDTLLGGAGRDFASYRFDELGLASGVSFSLAAVTGILGTLIDDGQGGQDSVSGIETFGITGSAFADTLTGSGLEDQIYAGAGDDLLNGGAGNDFILTGEAGNDTIDGGAGNDTLEGGDGDDRLLGAAGADVLDGGAGNDSLSGGAGIDEFFGGDGIDAVNFEGGAQGARVDLLTGTVTNDGFGNAETLVGVESAGGTRFGDIMSTGRDGGLIGRAGADSLTGGDGDNYFSPGSGADTVTGGGGSDTLDLSSQQADTRGAQTRGVVVNLVTGSVTDGWGSIDRVSGVEQVLGTGFGDRMTGDADANSLIGGGGADTLAGGDGNDFIAGFRNDSGADPQSLDLADVLTGGNGDDTLRGNGGADNLNGGAGDDNLRGDAGNDTLVGGAGRDFLSYRFDELGLTQGVNFSTAAVAGIGSFLINDGQGGQDSISGFEQIGVAGTVFNDTLTGGVLEDQLTGDAGNDSLTGGGGNDFALLGGAGNDTIRGGAGNDTIDGNDGDDVLAGELGFDTAFYDDSVAAVTVNLVTGRASGGAGNDTLSGIENLMGSNFDDTLTGNILANDFDGGAGNDTMLGGSGDDTLIGGAGDDLLDGGAGTGDWADYSTSTSAVSANLATGTGSATSEGSDTLTGIENLAGGDLSDQLTGSGEANRILGGGGNDTLTGGAGADTFWFYPPATVENNVDTITDFLSGTDKLEFSADSFSPLGAPGPIAADVFVLGTSAQDANDRLIYDSGTGSLFYDADGTGSGTAQLVANLGVGTALGAADIFVT
jgi:Ca2+-binding RTX toxin-like protein